MPFLAPLALLGLLFIPAVVAMYLLKLRRTEHVVPSTLLWQRPAGLARDPVLVIDTSASMASTDVTPDRLEAAKQLAIDALRELPAGGKVSVLPAGRAGRG